LHKDALWIVAGILALLVLSPGAFVALLIRRRREIREALSAELSTEPALRGRIASSPHAKQQRLAQGFARRSLTRLAMGSENVPISRSRSRTRTANGEIGTTFEPSTCI
jgi:hypothetical protein